MPGDNLRQTVKTEAAENRGLLLTLFSPEQSLKYSNSLLLSVVHNMSPIVGKPAFCICENIDADQLRGNREADQRLCFRYTDSATPLLPKSEISSL